MPAEAKTPEPDDYRDANRVLGTDRGYQAPLASFTGTPHDPAASPAARFEPNRANNIVEETTPSAGPEAWRFRLSETCHFRLTLTRAGFVFDQDTPPRGVAQQATVREIERRTGLGLFHDLAGNHQDAIETTRPALLKELGCGVGF